MKKLSYLEARDQINDTIKKSGKVFGELVANEKNDNSFSRNCYYARTKTNK